jgi:hypothetical protein
MAAGDLVTGDWELELEGLLISAAQGYDIRMIDGLGGTPAVISGDQRVARRHGTTAGDDYLPGRTITLEIDVLNSNHTARALLIDAFNAVFKPGAAEAPLVFQLPSVAGGAKRRIGVRTVARKAPIDLQHLYAITELSLLLKATDPRIYDNTETVDQVSLPTTEGGLSFNASLNFSFGAVSTGGTINAVNSGTFDTPVVFRINGPCVDPRITNVATSQTLALTMSIDSGDYVEIDTDARSVLLNGTASRYQYLTTSEWFDLPPGTTELDFRAATTTAATLTATYRSAWS